MPLRTLRRDYFGSCLVIWASCTQQYQQVMQLSWVDQFFPWHSPRFAFGVQAMNAAWGAGNCIAIHSSVYFWIKDLNPITIALPPFKSGQPREENNWRINGIWRIEICADVWRLSVVVMFYGDIMWSTITSLRITVASLFLSKLKHNTITTALVLAPFSTNSQNHKILITLTNIRRLNRNIDFIYHFLKSSLVALFWTEIQIPSSIFSNSLFIPKASICPFVY